ncbi:protein tyrosine phosphatase [Sediminicola sp. YIK13]|uniref:arsenate-mycothiol transferase ArsC n=1 Tax=Sediminicola sp. YIK13 TaxID=1453352 RepID=UPI000722F400|nr:protein-tyrosine-phosphatase [Sediminicola sp. YIK13]ALM07078.1 protein tyrosine phosphatase [Sediminicola sp. YIK13]
MNKESIFPELQDLIKSLKQETITEERKEVLQPLIDYIQNNVEKKNPINLNFICTHNSRRSHLSQVWAQTAAFYYGVGNVNCYSGGTEATALFPMAAATLEDHGFEVLSLSKEPNPIYGIKYAQNAPPIIGFSKTYDAEFNPKSNFAAVMTCSQADAGCPLIEGANKRIPITYEDPKAFDGTPQQAEKYRERSLQIATELTHVFSKIKA